MRVSFPKLMVWISCAALSTACSKVTLNNPQLLGNQSGTSSSGSGATAFVALSLSSIAPSTGTVTGGTPLTLTGAGFVSGMSITVGGSACANVTVTGTTSATCNAPSHSLGTVDIVAMTPDSQSATLTGKFTYVSAVNAVAGYAITSGGTAYSTANGVVRQTTIGALSTPIIQTGTGIMKVSGIQGSLYSP